MRRAALSLNVRDLEISGAPAPPLTGLALLLEPAGSGGKDQELLLTGAGQHTSKKSLFLGISSAILSTKSCFQLFCNPRLILLFALSY